MTVMAAQEPARTRRDTQQNDLLDAFLRLETPRGYRAELIEGEIVVTPPPNGNHEDVFSSIVRQVIRMSLTEMDVSGTKGLELPRAGADPANHFIPDAVFARREVRAFRDADPWMGPEDVEMVVEVTSTAAERDRGSKLRGYAEAGIPLYLLVDRERQTVVLHSEPSGQVYKGIVSVPYGKTIALPEPFGFELETSDFV